MYGWRARIGVILPSSNTTCEPEYQKAIPDGVSLHNARIKIDEVSIEGLKKMAEHVERAADELATAAVDVILFACTSGSFMGGDEWEHRLIERIVNETGIKSVTTSGAVSMALERFKCKKIAIATPYIDEINELEKRFFEDAGYDVLEIKGLGIIDNIKIGHLKPEDAYRLARQVHLPELDTLFISCTNFRTVEIIDKLESDLGIPVVTSNQASIWHALRCCSIREDIKGFGKLFTF